MLRRLVVAVALCAVACGSRRSLPDFGADASASDGSLTDAGQNDAPAEADDTGALLLEGGLSFPDPDLCLPAFPCPSTAPSEGSPCSEPMPTIQGVPGF